MTVLFGSKGNMGQRYSSILKYLRLEHVGIDMGGNEDIVDSVKRATRIVVAVPTNKHKEVLDFIGGVRSDVVSRPIPVLCEKPVVKKSSEFTDIRRIEKDGRIKVFCVNQYAHLQQYIEFKDRVGRSFYNYFKHGNDSLPWDCFQIFALANGFVSLSDQSPIWTCRINGVSINHWTMDQAYVSMIADFVGGMRRVWDLDFTERATRKVERWIEEEAQDILESNQTQN